MCKPLIDGSHLKVKLKTKTFAYGLLSLISAFPKMLRYNGE